MSNVQKTSDWSDSLYRVETECRSLIQGQTLLHPNDLKTVWSTLLTVWLHELLLSLTQSRSLSDVHTSLLRFWLLLGSFVTATVRLFASSRQKVKIKFVLQTKRYSYCSGNLLSAYKILFGFNCASIYEFAFHIHRFHLHSISCSED